MTVGKPWVGGQDICPPQKDKAIGPQNQFTADSNFNLKMQNPSLIIFYYITVLAQSGHASHLSSWRCPLGQARPTGLASRHRRLNSWNWNEDKASANVLIDPGMQAARKVKFALRHSQVRRLINFIIIEIGNWPLLMIWMAASLSQWTTMCFLSHEWPQIQQATTIGQSLKRAVDLAVGRILIRKARILQTTETNRGSRVV